jgi:hypothetical protein
MSDIRGLSQEMVMWRISPRNYSFFYLVLNDIVSGPFEPASA